MRWLPWLRGSRLPWLRGSRLRGPWLRGPWLRRPCLRGRLRGRLRDRQLLRILGILPRVLSSTTYTERLDEMLADPGA
jgi:hypothetical protein